METCLIWISWFDIVNNDGLPLQQEDRGLLAQLATEAIKFMIPNFPHRPRSDAHLERRQMHSYVMPAVLVLVNTVVKKPIACATSVRHRTPVRNTRCLCGRRLHTRVIRTSRNGVQGDTTGRRRHRPYHHLFALPFQPLLSGFPFPHPVLVRTHCLLFA